jgi:large subunit ribosomal protein L22
MEAKAKLMGVRLSPQKAKLVVDLVRGKSVSEALDILAFTNKFAAPIVAKLIKSAAANAAVKEMDGTKLYVAECSVCPGPTLKRIMPRAKGRADRILKRTSHITLAVKERN